MKINLESLKFTLLSVISICLIILVIQGFAKSEVLTVYVSGGHVDVSGGHVDVSGEVGIDGGEVNVNAEKVMGYQVGCHKSYTIDGKEYQAIDVFNTGY